MKNLVISLKYIVPVYALVTEVIKAKKDGKINQKEKSVLMTKFWAVLKVSQMPKGKTKKKKGLYANINAKRKRIAAGSGERMRKVGSKGAPTAKAFKRSKKTAKKR